MKKKMLLLLLTVSMVFNLAGCGEKKEEVVNNNSDEDYIAMIALGFSHQYWQAVKSGADQAAKDYGVRITFEGPETETMVDKQVDMLKTALGNNPVAVCMAAIDSQSVAGILQDAKSKDIKVVGFDAGVGEEEQDVYCSTNSYAAGEMAAENAARLLDEKGSVGIIGHSQTTFDAVERVRGFKEKIENDYPDMEIVDTQYGEGDHLKSAEIAKSMVQAHPEISLIFTSNEGACVGAYNGLKEVNKLDKVKLIGFDSSAAMKDAIRKGEIAGAITQDPIGMGYKAVESAVKLIKGQEVNEFIDTGCYWYDAANMDASKIKPLLYD